MFMDFDSLANSSESSVHFVIIMWIERKQIVVKNKRFQSKYKCLKILIIFDKLDKLTCISNINKNFHTNNLYVYLQLD